VCAPPCSVLNVSMSMGVVTDTGRRTAEELLRDADVALYTAKADGKRRLALHRTTRGPISPADFVPVAEQAGLIPAIGDLVPNRSLEALTGHNRRSSSRWAAGSRRATSSGAPPSNSRSTTCSRKRPSASRATRCREASPLVGLGGWSTACEPGGAADLLKDTFRTYRCHRAAAERRGQMKLEIVILEDEPGVREALERELAPFRDTGAVGRGRGAATAPGPR
jgi:hypothetical protein